MAISELGFLLHLQDLGIGMPGLTRVRGLMMAEAASVCLSHGGQQSGVTLTCYGDYQLAEILEWSVVSPQHLATYADLQEATEHGAYGVAILLLRLREGLQVIERSPKGPGFDYWLGFQDDDELPFQELIRLEVSGILQGDVQGINSRCKVKVAQVSPSNGLADARIVVVEFSTPMAKVVDL